MIYTPMTQKALRLAYQAHQGQVDLAGVPYVFHPFHLAEQMEDEISCTVALLHDVVEDTDVTLEELKKQFPSEVTEAVSLLTHTPDRDYESYILALKGNPTARKVKLADLAHNSDETRLADTDLSPEVRNCLREKYAKARRILLEEEDRPLPK